MMKALYRAVVLNLFLHTVFIFLTKFVTRFTLNILNNAHLLKNKISKFLQLYLFNVAAALVFWQRAVRCLATNVRFKVKSVSCFRLDSKQRREAALAQVS